MSSRHFRSNCCYVAFRQYRRLVGTVPIINRHHPGTNPRITTLGDNPLQKKCFDEKAWMVVRSTAQVVVATAGLSSRAHTHEVLQSRERSSGAVDKAQNLTAEMTSRGLTVHCFGARTAAPRWTSARHSITCSPKGMIMSSAFGGHWVANMKGSRRILGIGRIGFGSRRREDAGYLWLLGRAKSKLKVSHGHGLGGGFGGGSGGGGGGGGSGDGLGGGPSGDAGHFSPQLSIWLWYNAILESHPLISKSLTSGLLNCIADLFCQVFIEKVESIDWKRLLSFVAIGLFLTGPGLHFWDFLSTLMGLGYTTVGAGVNPTEYWYGALPRIVTVPGLGGVLLRIALDQLVFTPLGMVSFFVVLLTLEDRKDKIKAKLEEDWWPTVVANWKVWIPFQVVNFGFVPTQLQVPAAGLLGMIWSVFISYKGHT